jgi:hypothetical protein
MLMVQTLSGGDYLVIQKNGNSGATDIAQYSNAAYLRFGTESATS